MIKITIYKTKDQDYTGFHIEGHAGFAESGNDIVCAAVSILVINTINSIERLTNDETSCIQDEEKGIIKYSFNNSISHDASILIQSMIFGLQDIADDENYNGKFNSCIDITIEEV